MTAKEILKRKFGEDAELFENEIRRRIDEVLICGWDYEDVAEILMDYGLEMDYISEFI